MPGAKGGLSVFQLDYSDARPLYEQIKERFKTLIIRGVLASNQQLPSVREMASNLTLNPNTIQKAYRDLEAEGYIYSVRGKGNFAAVLSPALKGEEQMQLKKQLTDALTAMQNLGVPLETALQWVKAAYETERSDPK